MTEIPQIPHPSETFGSSAGTTSRVWWDWFNSMRRGLTTTLSLVKDIINVKDPDFGAVGDGTTLDDVAINAAIAYAESIGGGLLFFPAGVYMIERPIVLANNGFGQSRVRIMGAGMFTSGLKAKNGLWSGGRVLEVSGSTTVSDIFIDGNGQSAVNGIYYDAPANALPAMFDRVYIASCPGTGIYTTDGEIHINDSFINSCGVGVRMDDGAISSRMTDTTILGGAPCLLQRNHGNSNEGQVIGGCVFIPNSGQPGVEMFNGLENSFFNCVIEGAGAGTGKSIWLHGTGLSFIKVTDCWLGSGFRIDGGAEGIFLQGNTFPNGSHALFGGNSSEHILNVTIRGNHFVGNASFEKIVLDYVDRCIVHGNILVDDFNQIFETGGSNIWVDGNYLNQGGSSVSSAVTFGSNGGTGW